jgi:hypothetical protein
MGICNSCACGKSPAQPASCIPATSARTVSALRLCVNGALSDLVLDL